MGCIALSRNGSNQNRKINKRQEELVKVAHLLKIKREMVKTTITKTFFSPKNYHFFAKTAIFF